VEAARRIGRSTRFRLAPAATRLLGADLLVNAGGANAPVQRLMGTGPELWECFSRGLTVGEAVDHLAARPGAPADLEANVVAFGASLVSAGLAEPVP
jgi:hypothetical protein